MPGGGAAREPAAADGTQAGCIDAGSVQLDWHTHDADGRAALPLPVSPGPGLVAGGGAIASWAVAPARGEWAAGSDAKLCAVWEDNPAGSVEEVTAVMA
ncbi:MULTISPECIES: hypothetical protein [unclassified Arthrobacter]|uniref:hypothetical protein n=1 Tax=unclassified Arthrobacter TaxID=235627 RepID=UPI001E44BA9E|nr:hypothetical protein [Arthrobacter sp. Bi26]